MNALPIKTLFDIHDKTGVVAAEFSHDSKYLITLGNEAKQTLAIWDWTTDSEKPMISAEIQGEPQKCIRVNPEDPFELLTNGNLSVNFFTWERDGSISQHVPRLSSKDFKHTPSGFMSSSFIPTTNQSVTTTADGDVVVWTDRSLNNLSIPLERGKKAAVKFMRQVSGSEKRNNQDTYLQRLHNGSINFLTPLNKKYVITGGEDGHVKIFDLQFRLILCSQSWVDSDSLDSVVDGYDIPEFIVATKQAKIILLCNISAQYDKVYGLCAHPSQPQFAVAGHSGLIQVWDYSNKQLLASRKFEEHRSQDGNGNGQDVASSSPSGTAAFPPFNLSGIQAYEQQAQTNQDKEKKMQQLKKGQKEQPPDVLKVQSIAFSRDGALLAVGFANGQVRLLNSTTLTDHDGPRNPQGIKLANFWSVSKHAIMLASFSACGNYLAFADAGFAVTLFRKELKVGPKKDIQGQGPAIERLAAGTLSVQWVLIGRCQAHYKPIIYRHVAEYDIASSTITGGMTLKSIKRTEQSAVPLAATLFPKSQHSQNAKSANPHTSDAEAQKDGGPGRREVMSANKEISSVASDYFILTANSEYKLKLHNANTQLCRRTVLGPTYGGLLTNLKIVPETEGPPKFVAYATRDKVVGIIKLPLDGNPHRSMGLIAHPCSISNITTTYDGSYLLTAGVEDGAVHMWAMHPNALEAQISIGGKGIEPFLNMLDPSGTGADGPIYKEMEDYFYYAQLRTQGEDATNARLIQETVELTEVPSIMQAMGYYPSGQEIEDMMNEVKFSRIEEGELVDSISFGDLIKIFVNHRPVFDYTEGDLLTALVQAVRLEPGRLNEKNVPNRIKENDIVTKEGLLSLLQQYGKLDNPLKFSLLPRACLTIALLNPGETMSKSNFDTAFRALLINESSYNGILPEKFVAREFVENILGLQSINAVPTAGVPIPPSTAAALGKKGAAGGIFGFMTSHAEKIQKITDVFYTPAALYTLPTPARLTTAFSPTRTHPAAVTMAAHLKKNLPRYSMAEVAKHNKEDDAWIVVSGKIYDITDFIDGHPGGRRVLLEVAGQDATKQFYQFHRSDTVFLKYDSKLVIGLVEGAVLEETEYPTTEGPFGDLVAFGDPAYVFPFNSVHHPFLPLLPLTRLFNTRFHLSSWYQGWQSPYYNDTHRRLRAWVRQIVDTKITPYCHEWETQGQIPLSLLEELGAQGLLVCFTGSSPWPKNAPCPPPAGIKPEEWNTFHELIVTDELARCGSAGTVAAISIGSSIALPPIMNFGSEYLKKKVVPGCMAGKKTICLAITEPYAGSDVAGLLATAKLTPDGKHYVLNGEKKWITNGMWADFFVVAARTGGPGMGGISLLLAEKSMEGVGVRKIITQGGTGSGTAYVTFENVLIPKENLIGKENQGFKAIMFNFNRLGLCIGALRAARVCYEEAMKHDGVIRNKLAHMSRQIEATQSWLEFLCYQLCTMSHQEALVKLGGPIALLKAQCTVTVEYCAREASQILGGIAYTKGGKGEKVERIYRDVRAFAIPGGSEEIMLDLGIRQAQKVSQMMGAKL
ncbi:hypothetical protein HDU67_008807 [Dinochytrium kinnereticum]|nr:hypothetical protein HDU67_008807 [Dinochytrium kinnereticum]